MGVPVSTPQFIIGLQLVFLARTETLFILFHFSLRLYPIFIGVYLPSFVFISTSEPFTQGIPDFAQALHGLCVKRLLI